PHPRPEARPNRESLLVPQQPGGGSPEAAPLPDALPDDGFADGHAMLGLDEGDIVEDEQSRLADLLDLLHRPFRRLHPVTAPVKGPCAAEGAVPGAAAAELDQGARGHLADGVAGR